MMKLAKMIVKTMISQILHLYMTAMMGTRGKELTTVN